MPVAKWNGKVIAEAKPEDIIRIEGNVYFPKSSVREEFIRANTGHHTTCHWKGVASYYDLNVDGKENEAAAWYYPEPIPSSIDLVGEDFSNYIAFWHGVEVSN